MKYSKPNYLFVVLCLILIIATIKPASAYEEVSVENGGELSGTVKFSGQASVTKVLNVDRNPEYCGKTVLDESLIVNPENKGIQNVVVSLEGINKGKKHIPTSIVLENSKCHFVPHILGGVVGDTYELKNSDTVLHNTHLRFEGGSTLINVVLPPDGVNVKRPLTTPGILNANCDAHRFMKGNILVFDQPYFSITDNNGEFRISDIPPGHYKIKIWHETLPVKEKEVTIMPNKNTNLTVDLSFDK